MGINIKRFMCNKGLKINWLAKKIGMKSKTLYPKLDGSRAIHADELLRINAVLGTAFEGDGNGNKTTR